MDRKAAAIDGTDGRTPDSYIDSAPHTMRVASTTMDNIVESFVVSA